MRRPNFDIESSLPTYLSQQLDEYLFARRKWIEDRSYTLFDCDYVEFQSNINCAEVNGDISSSVATYLREKYLGIGGS